MSYSFIDILSFLHKETNYSCENQESWFIFMGRVTSLKHCWYTTPFSVLWISCENVYIRFVKIYIFLHKIYMSIFGDYNLITYHDVPYALIEIQSNISVKLVWEGL